MNEISFAESIDRLKESFLWAAAQGGNTQDCQALLEIGADINWKHTNGDTVLLSACRRGHAETVALLLAYGADSNIAGSDSMAPIHVAAARGDADTLDRLLEANTITTLKTRDGLTALDIAKAKGHESIYSRLMRSRKPINSRNTLSNPVLAEPAPSSSARENLPSLSNTLQQALQSPASGDTLPPAISTISNSSTSNRSSSANRRKPGGSNMGQTTPSSSSSSAMNYSIMGESTTSSTGSMEESIALKKLLESEISKRKKVESKLEVFAEQNKQLLEELTNTTLQVQSFEEQVGSLSKQLQRCNGDELLLQSYNIEDCEKLERELKQALSRVETRKGVLIKNQIEGQKEQRLCVICCEKEKSVVLLPCRHLCLCDSCSLHAGLDMCPLCRECIVHKISVFS